MKAAYQVALEQGDTTESGQPLTFILSGVFESMVNELIRTTDRFFKAFYLIIIELDLLVEHFNTKKKNFFI